MGRLRSTFRYGTAVGLMLAPTASPADPLLFYNGRLFVDTSVNGVSAKALLDSAAEATLIDVGFAKRAQLGPGTAQTIRGSGGTTTAHLVEGVTLTALGTELHPEAVIVTDLTELSRRLVKRPTQVILGREIFDSARLEIDIPARRIKVVGRTVTPRGTRLPLTPHAGVEGIPVLANGQTVQADFDLGNGSGVLVSRALADKLHLHTIGRRAGGGIGGRVDRDLVTLNTLQLAGCKFGKVTAAIDDQPNAAPVNVGTSIFKYFRVTTDYRDRAIWLQRKGCRRV
jgi:Aspartyl protease